LVQWKKFGGFNGYGGIAWNIFTRRVKICSATILVQIHPQVDLSGQEIPEIVREVDTSIKGKLIFLA